MRHWFGSLFRPKPLSPAVPEPAPDPALTNGADAWSFLKARPPEPRLGIGITTFNRRALLERVLDAVEARTVEPHVLFVADDGSSDGTNDLLAARDVPHLAAANRGIAWNKNRALYYLHRVRRCDIILLLEDDTFPIEAGWEATWIAAVERHGHVNLAPSHWPNTYDGGDGTPARPFLSRVVTGQCVGFSAIALEQAGYMDTRFRRYGFEHVEHTRRLIRCGFGGTARNNGPDPHFFLISSALRVEGLDKPPDMAGVAHNGPIMQLMESEPLLRPAWRTDEEAAMMRAEMASVSHRPVSDSGPDWFVAANDGASVRFEFEKKQLSARAAGPASWPVGMRVSGRTARLFAGPADEDRPRWLRFGPDNRIDEVGTPERATRFDLVYASGPGFGLRADNRFLCCELGAGDRSITHSRADMSAWETFRFDGYVPRHTDRAPLVSTTRPGAAASASP